MPKNRAQVSGSSDSWLGEADALCSSAGLLSITSSAAAVKVPRTTNGCKHAHLINALGTASSYMHAHPTNTPAGDCCVKIQQQPPCGQAVVVTWLHPVAMEIWTRQERRERTCTRVCPGRNSKAK
jgi:hypothetical protein